MQLLHFTQHCGPGGQAEPITFHSSINDSRKRNLKRIPFNKARPFWFNGGILLNKHESESIEIFQAHYFLREHGNYSYWKLYHQGFGCLIVRPSNESFYEEFNKEESERIKSILEIGRPIVSFSKFDSLD